MNRQSCRNPRPWAGLLVIVVMMAAGFSFPPQALAAGDTGPCSAQPVNRAFDFWLGDWTIAAPGGSSNATSKVRLELNECLVVERWDGGHGHAGENLFGYSADDKSWHGLFADNEGRVHVFLNGKVGAGSAEFTGPSQAPGGEIVLNRVTIRRIAADHVEQLWEKSSDQGKTWTTVFRGEYTRTRS